MLDGLPSRFFLFTVNVFENMVHSLKGPPSCFGYKIESPDQGQQAEDGEECISPEPRILDQRWSDQADDEIIQPI